MTYIPKDVCPSPITDDRDCLRRIVYVADVLRIGGQTYLLVPVAPATVDYLSALDAETDDFEDDDSDRCEASDDIGTSGAALPIIEGPASVIAAPGDPDDEEDTDYAAEVV